MLLPDGGVLAAAKKKKLPSWSDLTPAQQQALAPGAPVINIPGQSWQDIINADPLLGQDLGNINAGGVGDRANTQAALRAALVRFGGKGLSGLVGQLGGDWADLLDPTTLAAAQSGDTGGTSVAAQLEKAHKDRQLALEDVLAAKGIHSSGQLGYETGEERQRNTIATNDAMNSLLDALKGGIGAYAAREQDRQNQAAAARQAAMERAIALNLSPRPAQTIVQAPPTTPALIQQLQRNATRPIRRPIRGYE